MRRKDGKPFYWIRLRAPVDGQPQDFRAPAGPRVEDAVVLVEEARRRVENGTFDPADFLGRERRRRKQAAYDAQSDVLTVAKAIQHYLPRRLVHRNGRPKSERLQREDLRYAAYWTAEFGPYALSDITARMLRDWQEQRLAEAPLPSPGRKTPVQKDRVAPITVDHGLNWFRRILTLAHEDGLIPENPGRKVRSLAGSDEGRVRRLTLEEEAALRLVMKREHWLAVEFAIRTGLRQSEQFRLRWCDIDYEAMLLHVPPAVGGRRSKNDKTRRFPIDGILDLLAELSRIAGHSEWVFPTPSGPHAWVRPRDGHNFHHRTFKPALRAAGISDFTWHDLRHTFGSRMAMAGVPLLEIKELMGHSTIRVTEKYAHLDPGRLHESVKAVQPAQNLAQTPESPNGQRRKPR